MTKRFDFYFDFASPTSYLAHTQLPNICSGADATVNFIPILLGAVFQATGNTPPMNVPSKGKYMLADIKRYADGYGVVLNMNPHFPFNTISLMRIATALQVRADIHFQKFMDTVYHSTWVDVQDMNDPVVVASVLHKAGFDPVALIALANEQSTKDQLKAATARAVERGVFGVPSFFVDEQMFWGQDRVEFVKTALKG